MAVGIGADELQSLRHSPCYLRCQAMIYRVSIGCELDDVTSIESSRGIARHEAGICVDLGSRDSQSIERSLSRAVRVSRQEHRGCRPPFPVRTFLWLYVLPAA